jgi:putative transposase
MARKPRSLVVIPGWPHHFTTRGNNKRRVFSYPRDYLHFMRLVRSGVARADIQVHGLALMANHAHVIATPAAVGDGAEFMKHVSQVYAQVRNKSRETSGKLFEERYFCEPFRDLDHLGVATAYVDANGVRAGLVASPELHRWTSAGIHMGEPNRSDVPLDVWTPSPWYQRLGSGPAEVPFPEVDAIEKQASGHYTKRIRRPDGSSAREPVAKKWTGRPKR